MSTKIKEINNHKYLTFDVLSEQKNLNHAFVGKRCRLSYKEICKDLGFNYKKFCNIKKQSHTNFTEVVNNKKKIYNKDALITNKKNIPIVIRTSDCNSIILYDPKNEVVANVHSGWKGTIKRIIVVTLNKMINDFGCKSENIIACFFPSIRVCHFEVDEDIKEKFELEFEDINIKDFINKGEIKNDKQKYYIDTTNINIELLLNLGVKRENIYTTDYCTMCDNDLFYSYRKKDEERNLTIVELKGE